MRMFNRRRCWIVVGVGCGGVGCGLMLSTSHVALVSNLGGAMALLFGVAAVIGGMFMLLDWMTEDAT